MPLDVDALQHPAINSSCISFDLSDHLHVHEGHHRASSFYLDCRLYNSSELDATDGYALAHERPPWFKPPKSAKKKMKGSMGRKALKQMAGAMTGFEWPKEAESPEQFCKILQQRWPFRKLVSDEDSAFGMRPGFSQPKDMAGNVLRSFWVGVPRQNSWFWCAMNEYDPFTDPMTKVFGMQPPAPPEMRCVPMQPWQNRYCDYFCQWKRHTVVSQCFTEPQGALGGYSHCVYLGHGGESHPRDFMGRTTPYAVYILSAGHAALVSAVDGLQPPAVKLRQRQRLQAEFLAGPQSHKQE